jgi:hypothetical protein
MDGDQPLARHIRILTSINYLRKSLKKSRAIPVTGRGGPHFLDGCRTDGGDVSLTRSAILYSTGRFLVPSTVRG